MMIAIGLTRKTDHIGRITLPISVRRLLDIKSLDPMIMFVNGDEVILRKYKEHCVFCDNTESLITFKNKKLCPDCKEVLTGKLFEIIQF